MRKTTTLFAALFLTGLCAASFAQADDVTAMLAKASAENGAKLAKQCQMCHSFDKGGANKIGPNLFGVFGAAKAHNATFAYSAAMKAKGGTWDAASLDGFLNAPMQYVSGTKMTFAGLKKPEDRADVIKYLQSLK